MSNPPFSSTPMDSAPPEDFPWSPRIGSVTGSAPKILLTLGADGRYQAPAISDEERWERWRYCHDLANQFADAALRSKQGRRAHMSEADILDQYLPRLIETGWVNGPEAQWVINKSAHILGWPAPNIR